MPTYYDSKNQLYVLAERIGSGGEGTVFSCPNDDKTVAKIYHEPITDEKAGKLRWMADNKNGQLLKVAAWIIDTLHDAPGGKTVGFLMPNVRAKEIHELYSLKSRRIYFPEATWQFLIHAAANLARAFYNLHNHDHIMGDVNHGNCVVLADATVKLIDCDSYSIKLENRRYPCEVGVATHLAPELQGVNLRAAERLKKHDNFGLAVIIFQLLFLGRHPFAGNYTGGEDKSLEDSIRELRFAYGADAHRRNVKRPPGTLSLAAVSPRLAEMFERAFLTENRPEPREWIEALEDLSNNLKSCSLHPGHHYYKELQSCPWCEIEAQTGLMLFPFVSSTNRLSDGESFNIFTVENLVASFDVQRNLPAVLPKSKVLPPSPSPEAKNIRKEIRNRFILLAAVQFFVTAAFVLIFGGCTVFIPSLFILIVCLTSFNSFAKTHRINLEINMDSAQRNWGKLEKEWEKVRAPAELNDNLAQIRKNINDYQNLHKDSRQTINLLRDAHFRRETNDYLGSFRLTDNQISGIGEKRLGVLRDFGIKTAADVEKNRLLSIPGTGEVTTQKLLEWRKNLEGNFQYQPDSELFKTKEEEVERNCSETRRNIEKEIGKLLIVLRSSSVRLRRQQQELFAKSETFAQEFSQAEGDLTAIALKVPAMLTMIIIAFFMVVFGNIVNYSPTPTHSYKTINPSPPMLKSGEPSAPPPIYSDNLEKYAVSENITDEKIKAMSAQYREYAATNLHNQSLGLTDYEKVERKLRLAVRLNADDIFILNRLGYVLYEQKKYKQSLKILNQSLKLDSENLGTKTYIGMNYIRMERFADAVQIFADLTREYPGVDAVFYNLGLAYKGLKDYHSAVNAFRSAVEISPNDADSRYEIGYCLYKTGDEVGARKEYQTLRDIDTETAEKLLQIIEMQIIQAKKQVK